MRHLRTATLTTIALLALGGGLVWSATGNTPTPVGSTGVEAASALRSTPSIPVRSTVNQPTSPTTPAQTSIPTETTQTTTKAASDATKTTGQQPNNAEKPKHTTTSTTSTVQRPEKMQPTATTAVSTSSGDPNRIVDNGYINLDGVRVSGYTEANPNKNYEPLVERCGRIGEQAIYLWFNYADGSSRVERWIFNGKQAFVFETDRNRNLALRRVYVEASGRDPYGEWTEENGWPTTEWIWCANFKRHDS